MKKALKQYMLSAEQGHPPALCYLSRIHGDGVPGLVKKSAAKAKEYLQKAADSGNFHAMINLAAMSFRGKGNRLGGEFPTATKYATLASHYSTDKSVDNANLMLGNLFSDGLDENGLGSSDNLATYYLGLTVKNDLAAFHGEAALRYSRALTRQAENLYGINIPGLNVLPRAIYWMRKSLAAGNMEAKRVINNCESNEVGKCYACGMTEESSDKKFLRCGRCKIYWYCSKECQVVSWKVGHKEDCKSTFC